MRLVIAHGIQVAESELLTNNCTLRILLPFESSRLVFSLKTYNFKVASLLGDNVAVLLSGR